MLVVAAVVTFCHYQFCGLIEVVALQRDIFSDESSSALYIKNKKCVKTFRARRWPSNQPSASTYTTHTRHNAHVNDAPIEYLKEQWAVETHRMLLAAGPITRSRKVKQICFNKRSNHNPIHCKCNPNEIININLEVMMATHLLLWTLPRS